MARETKFGLGLIAVLCTGLIGAIVWRVSREMAAARSTPATEIVQATSPPPNSHEPPKLLLSSTDGEPGEAKPPTKAAAVPKKSDTWGRAQLASAAEPASLPAKHRYPLMPAAATTDQRPSLAKDEVPADFSPAVLPHTSFRPEDGADSPSPISPLAAPAAVTAPATSRRYRATETAPQSVGEAVTIAGQQSADVPRYAEPAFTPSAPATVRPAGPMEPDTTYAPAAQRSWPRTDAAPRNPRTLAPAPAPLAPAPDRGDGTTVVRPNDTFWTISQRAYGTGGYFKALIHYNSEKHPQPDQLAVGDTVLVPPVAELVQKYPQLCPKLRRGSENDLRNAAAPMTAPGGRRYEVREGDTLFDIARYELGDGARWVEIYQLNRDQLTDDFHYLKPGSTLNLPSRQPPSERVAREPTNTRLR